MDQLPRRDSTPGSKRTSKCQTRLDWKSVPTVKPFEFFLSSHGLVGHRTVDNSAQFKQPLAVAYYGVDYVKNPKGTNYWRNRILKVAKAFADDFKFAISNKDDFQQELNEYGMEFIGDDKPRVALKDASGSKFVMTEPFS